MNVGILVFDEVELLDMAGPYEVFTTASRVLARTQPPGTPALFSVTTIARRPGVRWVDQGAIMTSAGISAGIDMSLHLVQRLHSRDLALRTARQMDFDWKPQA